MSARPTARLRSPAIGRESEGAAVTTAENHEDSGRWVEDWIVGVLDGSAGPSLLARPGARWTSSLASCTKFRVVEERGITILRLVDRTLIHEADIDLVGGQLNGLIEQGHDRIVLDFSRVERMSSRVLGSVIDAHRRCVAVGGLLKVCGLRREGAELFAIAGLGRVLSFHPDGPSALAGAWPAPPRPRALPIAELMARRERMAPASPAERAADDPRLRPIGRPARPDPGEVRVWLIVMVGRDEGRAIEVAGARFLIGHDPHCQLRPNSTFVSRIHAIIERRGARVFVRDPGSTNGTTLNGRTIRGEEVEVIDGDRLGIEPLLFTFAIRAVIVEVAMPLESLVAGWLLGDDLRVDPCAETEVQPAPSEPPSAVARPIRAVSGEVRHLGPLRFEVLLDVLVITIGEAIVDDERDMGRTRDGLDILYGRPLPRRVTINLCHLTRLSNRVVGVLVAHALRLDRAGGAMRLCHVPAVLMADVERLRLPMLTAVFPTVDEAVLASWA